jgi:dihydrofolate reductase
MSQSLDGYVAGVTGELELPPPGPVLFRHFYEWVRDLTGSLDGRRVYEVMRYWDEDRAEWSEPEHDFAAAWRKQPKWVVSRSLKSVGPNATLVADGIEAEIHRLKARPGGEIEVAGPGLARSLADLGLLMSIDCTSAPSCSVGASRSSPAPGRRSASWRAIELARTRSG